MITDIKSLASGSLMLMFTALSFIILIVSVVLLAAEEVISALY